MELPPITNTLGCGFAVCLGRGHSAWLRDQSLPAHQQQQVTGPLHKAVLDVTQKGG
jgi:hypothetical protein